MYQDIIIRETESLPEYLKKELLDFLLFLKDKQHKRLSAKGPVQPLTKPAFGCGKVKVKMSTDFDEPLDEFKDYMQ